MTTEDFLATFTTIWKGGYYEGDPLDAMSSSSYGVVGYNSILYTTYLACIRPYVTERSTAIEIGPGRGAWTKAILARNPRKIYAVDAAPPEHTGFWEYVGKDSRLSYVTAKDFSLDGVPEQSADFFFSFGVFCHLRPEHSRQYISSLYEKMAPGANGFLMIGDFDKYSALARDIDRYSICKILHGRRKFALALAGYRMGRFFWPSEFSFEPVDKRQPLNLAKGTAGSWYHFGLDEACQHIEAVGFRIVDKDICVNPRDPVIHFRRPAI